MKKAGNLCFLIGILIFLSVSCTENNSSKKTPNPNPFKPEMEKQKNPAKVDTKPEVRTEIKTIEYPRSETPTSPIPAQAFTTEEMVKHLENLITFHQEGDRWYVFGGSLGKWPPDLDGSPKIDKECLEHYYSCNFPVRIYFTFSEWDWAKIFAQYILYNYEAGDPQAAGQLAWFLDNNIPWAKYLVAAWAEYFIPRYENFNYNHRIKVVTSVTREIIITGDKRDYNWEKPPMRSWTEIDPIRDENGVLTNPYQCVNDPDAPVPSLEKSCPWMVYADETIDKKLDGLDKGIFYLGPQGTKKAIRLLIDVSDILMNHPEKMIPLE